LREKKYIAALSLCVVVILLCFSCGKKADPRPIVLPLPGGIHDLSGEVKDGVLFLSFSVPTKNSDGSEVKDLAGFKVYKACGTCLGGFEQYRDLVLEEKKGYTLYGGKTYFYDDDLLAGFEYSYRIYPYTKKGTRGDGSNIIKVLWQNPPGPVKGLSAKGSDEKVELSWDKEEGFSYNVYRYENGVYPLFPVNKGPVTADSFLDPGLENDKQYTYEVRKVQTKGGMLREGEGTKVTATPVDRTPPARPSEMKAEKVEGGVMLTWKKNNEKDLAGYNIYRISTGKPERLNSDLLKENSYLDRAIPDMRYLSYYVTALDRAGSESEASREVVVIVNE
jgi:fibronectin type 3 domain-containing protein